MRPEEAGPRAGHGAHLIPQASSTAIRIRLLMRPFDS